MMKHLLHVPSEVPGALCERFKPPATGRQERLWDAKRDGDGERRCEDPFLTVSHCTKKS